MPFTEMIPSAAGILPTDGFMAPSPKFSSTPASATAAAAVAATPAAATTHVVASPSLSSAPAAAAPLPSRYESQKRRDWNTFGQYLKNHRPPMPLSRCNGTHVLDFLRYLDQFGKTKVHMPLCPFFGHPNPPAPCPCPLRQAWGSLDALIGRLRAAFEENGGKPEMNPFGARAVRMYLREVREMQAKARGISYDKKKRKKPLQKQQQQQLPVPALVVPPLCRSPLTPPCGLPDCAAPRPSPVPLPHDDK